MKKIYALTKEQFEALPETIKAEAKEILKAYDCVSINYYYGEYHAEAGAYVLGQYPDDYKAIGNAYSDDIFTEDERVLNFVEAFHYYPTNYKGKPVISWKEFKEMPYNAKFGYNEDGDIVRIA